MTRTKKALIGVVALMLLITAAPAALAQTNTDNQATLTEEERTDRLERAKERVIKQIERRIDRIGRLETKVANADHVTANHAAALGADFAAADSTLTAGVEAVGAAATFEELRETATPTFESTLVFALLGPKTHAVIASDAIAAAPDRYEELAARLQDALDRLAEAGVDIDGAQDDLTAAIEAVASAAATASPVADSVVGLQPGDEIAGPLADAKATLSAARDQLRESKRLTRSVIEFIRSQATSPE